MKTAISGEHLFEASQMLSEITGVPVQPNKAITGRNAFAHEAGIHQDGILKNPLTYEIMTPQSVGVARLETSYWASTPVATRWPFAANSVATSAPGARWLPSPVASSGSPSRSSTSRIIICLELIRDTHKPAASATPLFEPLPTAVAAAASAGVSIQEPSKPFPMAPQTNAFGALLPIAAEHHHEQEDYLWGV